MKLEEQIIDFGLSKELANLGVKQESLFYWMSKSKQLAKKRPTGGEDYYSAFTVAELGEMLPEDIKEYSLVIQKMLYDWWVGYEVVLPEDKKKSKKICLHFERDTEVNARAKMLIYLIENKLVKI